MFKISGTRGCVKVYYQRAVRRKVRMKIGVVVFMGVSLAPLQPRPNDKPNLIG
jgi:hypothetical protein